MKARLTRLAYSLAAFAALAAALGAGRRWHWPARVWPSRTHNRAAGGFPGMADAEGASARGRRWFRATTLPGNVPFDGCQRAPYATTSPATSTTSRSRRP